jgi:hypothetical protein
MENDYHFSSHTINSLNASSLSSDISGLAKFSGEWNFESAAHLFRRTTFGATGSQIKEAAKSSLDEVMDLLFAEIELPSEPINYRFDEDPYVPIGESWVGKPVVRSDQAPMIASYRRSSIRVWQLDNLINSDLNIREQMTLFWHSHFVTEMETVRDASFTYHYITKLRENATGNFKLLTELITLDPSMLRYLNGNQNSNSAPNENYARELLELFTIGKGQLAGEGDYTTFTEQDVTEAAKVLTGWRDTGYFGRDDQEVGEKKNTEPSST